jgi:hypothetical protein
VIERLHTELYCKDKVVLSAVAAQVSAGGSNE